MKKILLTTAAIAAISTSAFADMVENQVYLRADLIGSYFTKFKTGDVKIKPKFGFGVDVGVGYYFMDNLRAELVYNHPFANNMKGSLATGAAAPTVAAAPAGAPAVANSRSVTDISVKHKPTIHAVFAKLHADVIDLGMGKIFLTGGLGWAQVKNSITATRTILTGVAPVAGGPVTAQSSSDSKTYKQKNKHNLAWTIGAGAAFDVAEGVHLDVAYGYRDYGKAKSIDNLNGKRFTSHNVSAGVRFDI